MSCLQTHVDLVLLYDSTPTGTDTFNDMKRGKWKRGRELLDLVSVVVISRPGVPYAPQEDEFLNHNLHFYNVPSLGEVSSTAVRKTTDLRLLREVLEPRVLEYIRERGLYTIGRIEGGGGLGGAGRSSVSSFYSYTSGKKGKVVDDRNRAEADEGQGLHRTKVEEPGRRRVWWAFRIVWTVLALLLFGGIILGTQHLGWRKTWHGFLKVLRGMHRIEKG